MKILIYRRGSVEKIIPANRILEVVCVQSQKEEILRVRGMDTLYKYYFRTAGEKNPIHEKDYTGLFNFLTDDTFIVYNLEF